MVRSRKMCACLGSVAVLFVSQAGFGAPVGLLESIDVEVLQGGASLYHFTNVVTSGNLSGQDIYLGTLAFKFFLSLAFIVVFLFGFKPESKMFVVPFFLLFIIYKAFETWMLLKFAREPEGKD